MPVKEEVIAEGGSEPVDVSLNYMPTEERKTVETDIGYTWTVDSSDSLIKSGTIEYTLDQVYICQTIDDLPIAEEKCFEPYEAYFADYQDDRLILQRFPDFVEADGSFCNNGRIVICDIKAHNIDAIPNAVGGGKYSEDYLFRADNILILVDTKEEKQGLAEGKVYLPTYFDNSVLKSCLKALP